MNLFRPLLICGALAAVSTAGALPTNNPVAEHYGPEAFPWTDELPWASVFDVTTFPGETDEERFYAAQEAVVAAGGGVVYFPAGVYTFTDHLELKDGVILRGPAPATAATEIDFAPPARLEFPKYHFVAEGEGTPNDTAFKFIRVAPDNLGSRHGVVNLDVNRAGLRLGGGHPDVRNVIAFGVRSNNVAEASDQVPWQQQHAWQRHSWRFTRNINAFAYENVLVANCRINDKHWLQHRLIDGRDTFGIDLSQPEWEVDDFEQEGFLIAEENGSWATPPRALAGHQAVFSYTDNYGIAVRGSAGGFNGAAPHESPSLFRRGVSIEDNWVYGTMRVKIHTSGDGLVIRNNTLRDRLGKQHFMHPTGQRLARAANTLENRGIDWSGRNVLVENNDVEVFRHQMRGTHYYSVDGEGILFQECCGGTIIDGIILRNNTTNAYIGIYKQPYLRNALIEHNTVTLGETAGTGLGIFVDANTNNRAAPLYNVIVRDNTVEMGMRVTGDVYGEGSFAGAVHDNMVTGILRVSDHVDFDAETNVGPDGEPLAADRVIFHETRFVIPPAPEVDFLIATDPDRIRPGEVVALKAFVTNDTPVDHVAFYQENELLGTVSEPPYELITITRDGGTRFSAVARQPAVQTTLANDVQFTSAFLEPDSDATGGALWSAWVQDHVPAHLQNEPGLPYMDVNGNGSPAILDFLAGGPAGEPASLHIETDSESGNILVSGVYPNDPAVRLYFETTKDFLEWSSPLNAVPVIIEEQGEALAITLVLPPESDARAVRLGAEYR
ncbi:MAG: right-handed parallel beta-helix repeat-containing protein [Opitutales bacterium]|nr:right-handed parallel beta-helix repeat-containing protein [Opitutales bacterium]